MSKDGTELHIFSGYNKFGQAALSTLQSIGVKDWGEEQEIVVAREGEPKRAYFSRHASAITLASGDILVTGGMRRETEVFLVDGRDLTRWTPRSSMHHPRSGHSIARIVLDREEKVLVVGGWDKRGVCQATAEIHSLKDDSWVSMPSLPTPRVDFTLKVISECTLLCDYEIPCSRRARIRLPSLDGEVANYLRTALNNILDVYIVI